MQTDTTTRQEIIETLGLTAESTFVPFSQSRNKDEKHKSLNWLVTIRRGNRSMTVEYMQGIAHHPQYKQAWGNKTYAQRVIDQGIAQSCETGKQFTYMTSIDRIQPLAGRPLPKPTLEEVLYCLTLDSGVLNYATYEEWAHEFGYDEDSRKGEQTYQACLKQALQFKQLVNEVELEALREVYQDY